MKIDLTNDSLQAITCGVIDARYGEALEGTHHLVRNGRTLCGRWPANTRSTIWFGLEAVHNDEQADCTSCRACRKIAGLEGRGQNGLGRVTL